MTTHKTLLLRSSLVAAGLLFFCASPSFAQQAGQMPPPQVTVVDVKPQTVALSYEYAARISAFRQVDVRARVGGILLKRNFVEGAEVKAGDVLFLIDPATYKAALAQAQAQLQQSQAQLTQTQREEKRNVTLFQQNAATQKARAVVENPDRRLLPGQFVRARVTGVSLDNAITIPEVALMQSPQGQFVYTIDQEGKAHINPVTLGQKIGSNWLVLSGLKAGDKLITEGIIKVRPGAPVQATADAAPKDAKKVAQN